MPMYGHLIAEMKKNKVTQDDFVKLLGLSANSVSQKINGRHDFRSSEMILIHEAFFPDKDFKTLFTKI